MIYIYKYSSLGHVDFDPQICCVLPHGHSFQYTGCSVCGVCGLTEIHQLQKLQSRAARTVTGSSYDAPSKPPIKTLGWQTIDDLIQNETQIMVFKSVTRNGLALHYLSDLFVANSTISSNNLKRTATNLRLPKKMSSNGQKSFSYRGVETWNSLPLEIKRASNLGNFKSSILAFLIFIRYF